MFDTPCYEYTLLSNLNGREPIVTMLNLPFVSKTKPTQQLSAAEDNEYGTFTVAAQEKYIGCK